MSRIGIMVDTETLGTDDNAVVVQMHFTSFSLEDPLGEVNHFGSILQLKPQVKMGRTIDAETLLWWMEKEDDARCIFSRHLNPELVGNREELYNFLQSAVTWLQSTAATASEVEVWQFGGSFDTRVIKSLMGEFELEWPLHYRAENDLRTLMTREGVDKGEIAEVAGYVKHNARFDCLQQIRWYYAAVGLI